MIFSYFCSNNRLWVLVRTASLKPEYHRFTLSDLQDKKSHLQTAYIDETAHNEPSHQALHCLPFFIDFWLTLLFASMDVSKLGERIVHFRNSGLKGLE